MPLNTYLPAGTYNLLIMQGSCYVSGNVNHLYINDTEITTGWNSFGYHSGLVTSLERYTIINNYQYDGGNFVVRTSVNASGYGGYKPGLPHRDYFIIFFPAGKTISVFSTNYTFDSDPYDYVFAYCTATIPADNCKFKGITLNYPINGTTAGSFPGTQLFDAGSAGYGLFLYNLTDYVVSGASFNRGSVQNGRYYGLIIVR